MSIMLWSRRNGIIHFFQRHHDDAIKLKHVPRHWPFVRGIHWSPVNPSQKGQWRGALMFSLIFAWKDGWENNPEVGGLRRHHIDKYRACSPHTNVYYTTLTDSPQVISRLAVKYFHCNIFIFILSQFSLDLKKNAMVVAIPWCWKLSPRIIISFPAMGPLNRFLSVVRSGDPRTSFAR